MEDGRWYPEFFESIFRVASCAAFVKRPAPPMRFSLPRILKWLSMSARTWSGKRRTFNQWLRQVPRLQFLPRLWKADQRKDKGEANEAKPVNVRVDAVTLLFLLGGAIAIIATFAVIVQTNIVHALSDSVPAGGSGYFLRRERFCCSARGNRLRRCHTRALLL